MIERQSSNLVGNGVLDINSGDLVASDAVLNDWLGSRSLMELLPDLDLASATRVFERTRICPFNAEPAFAAVQISPLEGHQRNWRLIRVEIGPTESEDQYRDALTDLPDRRALESRRARWHSESVDSQVPHALLFMDLDGFKQINDQFGHAVGDRVLTVLADRWRRALRSRDLVVRYGGDEFVVLIAGIRSFEDVQPIVDRLKRVTAAPIVLDNHTLEVYVTIGVALAESANMPLEELLTAADQAMYAARRAGH